jgi:hypothetical protein
MIPHTFNFQATRSRLLPCTKPFPLNASIHQMLQLEFSSKNWLHQILQLELEMKDGLLELW